VKILTCFGTRPEAIKMVPLINELKSRAAFDVKVCVTAQHRQMLDQVLDIFGIQPDFDLNLMSPNQSLATLTAKAISEITTVLEEFKPELVVVQGDTTSTFASALAAFYLKIQVAHLEAGLRTYQRYSPFPEEINRQMTSSLTDWHFPPTERAREALLAEGYPADRVFVVGNTVVDALISVEEKSRACGLPSYPELQAVLEESRFVLVTGHRRENFGQGFLNICQALKLLAADQPEVRFVYPVHLNPNVQEPVNSILGGLPNIHLISPLDYLEFVWLMNRCTIVLTDSGGVQEEAPSFGKPVLVMRDTTERPEAVDAGVAKLVATDPVTIFRETKLLLENTEVYRKMSTAQNPYGDGTASLQIADILIAEFCKTSS